MKMLKEKKGFTLIELAIVLVIIGIIIGAILKGQDLIEGARHKRFTNEGKKWEVATWSYLDRRGRFPGDGNRDGIIGDGSVAGDFGASGLIGAPTASSWTVGGYIFYFFLGNVGSTPPPVKQRNVLVVCASATCGTTAFTVDDQREFLVAFDVAIDGEAKGDGGVVRGTSSSISGTSATWVATLTTDPTFVDWTSDTTALLYYFDRRP